MAIPPSENYLFIEETRNAKAINKLRWQLIMIQIQLLLMLVMLFMLALKF